MRRFGELYDSLDAGGSDDFKLAALAAYFGTAAAADAAWALYLLSGRRMRRIVAPAVLLDWLREESGLPRWLIDESRSTVGDVAETIALLIEPGAIDGAALDLSLATWIEERIAPLRNAGEKEQRESVVRWWRSLPYRECLLVNKLLTGTFRLEVPGFLLTRALARALDVPSTEIACRLATDWQPSETFWENLRGGGRSGW